MFSSDQIFQLWRLRLSVRLYIRRRSRSLGARYFSCGASTPQPAQPPPAAAQPPPSRRRATAAAARAQQWPSSTVSDTCIVIGRPLRRPHNGSASFYQRGRCFHPRRPCCPIMRSWRRPRRQRLDPPSPAPRRHPLAATTAMLLLLPPAPGNSPAPLAVTIA